MFSVERNHKYEAAVFTKTLLAIASISLLNYIFAEYVYVTTSYITNNSLVNLKRKYINICL